MNQVGDKAEQLAHGMAAQKEALIKKAIDHAVGDNDWGIKDITSRGLFRVLSDKTEIFCFDGIDLIHFMIPETVIDNSVGGMLLTVNQYYKVLY